MKLVCVRVCSCIKQAMCQQPSCNYGILDMSVGFCPCAALDEPCMRRQTVTATDSRPDNKDSDGSGDEDFLYYYYYYVDDDDTKSK